jgi:hypothetical protein
MPTFKVFLLLFRPRAGWASIKRSRYGALEVLCCTACRSPSSPRCAAASAPRAPAWSLVAMIAVTVLLWGHGLAPAFA